MIDAYDDLAPKIVPIEYFWPDSFLAKILNTARALYPMVNTLPFFFVSRSTLLLIDRVAEKLE